MTIIGSISDISTTNVPGVQPLDHGTIYQLLSCVRCRKPTLRGGGWHELMEENEWSPVVIYPEEKPQLAGLPSDIRREYDAAEQVATISPNAYAVLLGRVLDCVCVDRGAAGDTLHRRLLDLAARNEIPKNLADMAQQLRQFRNVAAHADLGSLTESEIPVVATLCRAVLEYVYQAPKLIEAVEQRLAACKAQQGTASSNAGLKHDP